MKGKYWYIKERHNPQLGVYYSAVGNISVKRAKEIENSIYGFNVLHSFKTEAEYITRCNELGIMAVL